MRKVRLPLFLAWAALTVACTDRPATGPDEDPDLHRFGSRGGVSVLSWNVYVGADVDAIIAALADGNPANDLDALLTGMAELEATDYPARAAAFADAIAAKKPHAVGLQEITTFNIDLRPIGMDIVLDLEFLPILEAELAARGLNYVVADSINNIDAQPMPGMVRMRDYDVLLVDASRVQVLNTVAKTFEYNLSDDPNFPEIPGVALRRGWVMATASIDGGLYHIVSTHPEPDFPPFDLSELRYAQIAEIVVALQQAPPAPAIVMGDLNDVPGSKMYQTLTDAGFVDAWDELRLWMDGNTCCHLSDLSNPWPNMTKRIDYIFARGFEQPRFGLTGWIHRLGIAPWERIDGPDYKIWPSDHAGLAARFRSPPAQ